jgi:hypothetical protein
MKASLLGLLIAAGAFGASTIYLAVQLEAERDRADEVLAQTRELNQRIAELEKARAELEARHRAVAAVPGSVPAPAGSPAAPGVPPQSPTPAVEPSPGERGSWPERSEASQRMMRSQMRANFKRLHADIGDQLGLSKEDANKLIDLLVDQRTAAVEIGRKQRAANTTSEQRAAEFAANQKRNLEQVSALIGADKMELYKDYQETMPARQEVDVLSRQLEGNDAGLSPDQRDRMVTALAEERKRVPQPKWNESVSREDFNKEMTAWQEEYNERAATRARSILNSDQQEAYAEYQQWTREMRQQFETRRAAREARAGAGGPPGGAPAVPPR